MKSRKYFCALALSLPILIVVFCCMSLSVYVGYEKKTIQKERSATPISNVFDRSACLPPCWNNIQPGVSTREDVLAFRDQLDKGTFEFATSYDETHYIFTFINHKTITKGTVVSFIINDVGQVQLIEFEGNALSKFPISRLPLWYVLQSFGEPEYAISNEYRHYPLESLVLYYPASGIEVTCASEPISAPVIGITISAVDCELDSDTEVFFYSPEFFFNRLILEYGSPEKAAYAQQFFCPWVGIDASYLLPNWGPFNYPEEYPTVPPAEIQSRCPRGE
jgi:hypothetical protein